MYRPALLAAAAAIVAAAPALAQTAPDAPPPGGVEAQAPQNSLTVGAGAAYVPDYDGSNNYRVVPAPLAIGSFHGFNFTLIGNRLTVDLIPDRPGPSYDLQLGPIGVVNFNRSSANNIDDFRVRRLPERSTAIELGGFVGIGKTGVITSPYDKLTATISYRHDVSGVHKSYVWQPSVNYLTPLSRKFAVGLTGSASYAGRGYAETYYSVTPGDRLLSGLPVYTAHSGWNNYSLGGFSTYAITGDLLHGFKVVAGGTYTRNLNSASYTPLTRIAGSPNQFIGAVGLAYTF